jgi:hypothetical protein
MRKQLTRRHCVSIFMGTSAVHDRPSVSASEEFIFLPREPILADDQRTKLAETARIKFEDALFQPLKRIFRRRVG